MSNKTETVKSNSERYTDSEEFKKISTAILDTYGQEIGISMIVHLIHELEKPTEKQIEYVPNVPTYPTYPYYNPNDTGTPPCWDWQKVTCDGNSVEMSKVPSLNGPYIYTGPVPDVKLTTKDRISLTGQSIKDLKDTETSIANGTDK